MMKNKDSIAVVVAFAVTLPVLGFFSGCATVPDSQVGRLPVAVPENWDYQQADPEPIATGWLADFEAPALVDWVTLALEQNFDLRATAARLAAARADAVIAGANLSPQLGIGMSGARQKFSLRARGFGDTGSTSVIFDNFDLGASLNWEIDVWGRLRDTQSAAMADVEVAVATYQGARLSLAARVCTSWFDVIEAQQQLRLSAETVASFESTESVIAQRFENGVSSALDLHLIRSQLEAARADLAVREQRLDSAVRGFQLLVGNYPKELPVAGVASFPEIKTRVPAGLPSDLLYRRPDLVVAERRVAAAAKRVGAAKKALLPSFSLTSAYGTSSDQLSDLLTSSFSVWNVLGNIAQPVFQGRRLKAGVQKAQANLELSIAEYGGVALVAFREVEQSLAAGDYLEKRREHLEATAKELKAAEALAWARYQRGLSDIITVLDTQRRSYESASFLIVVNREQLLNRVQLYLALGGDFQIAGE